MKAKNIKSVCKNKIRDLCEHIDDPKVAEAVLNNSIITGGAIASMLLGEPVNDFDIYFRDRETTILVADYFVAKFKLAKQLKFKDGDRKIDVMVDKSKEDRISIKIQSAGFASVSSDDTY